MLATMSWAATPLVPGSSLLNPASPFATPATEFTLGPVPAAYTLVASNNFPYNYDGTTSGSFSSARSLENAAPGVAADAGGSDWAKTKEREKTVKTANLKNMSSPIVR